MSQTIKPAPTQLFCKVAEAETRTKSGFYIPEKHAERPQMAEVINIGSKVSDFQQKDLIIYKPYATVELKLDGKEYFLVDQEDVLGTVLEV
jgi:chaperonin GroES